MKILFVTDLYPIGEENIAKALFYFVQEWKNQGHEIEVIRANYITNTKLRGRKIINEKIYFEQDIKIYNLNFKTPFLFNVYNKLPKDFSLKNYDVLISHMPCGNLMAQKLLKKDKIKYVCSVHNSDITVLTNIKYLPFRNAIKKGYKLADKISARSPILQEKIEKIYPNDKTFVAPSGVEENTIEAKITFNKNPLTITTVASLIKRKNIDIIIKSVKEMENITLNIIGDGKEEKRLKALAKKNENIKFLGKLPHNEVLEKLKNSDVFVLLSKNETFGLCYLEAMAKGNIVIAKKDDGIDGILINEENGFLINATKEDLKKCLNKILSLHEEEIAQIRANSYNTIKSLTSFITSKNYLKNIK